MRSAPRIRRAAAVAVGLLLGLTGLAAVGSPASAGATGNHDTECVAPEKAEYRHWFDGPAGTAAIELLNGPLCAEQAFALVSYTAPSAQFATPQHVLDTSVKKFVPATGKELSASKLEFKVEVPECFTQVDFVFGDEIIDPLTDNSDRYNSRKVGEGSAPGNRSKPADGQPRNAWYNGGSGTCVAEPAVEAMPDCEGNVAIELINRSTFSETFTITADGGFSKTETLAARQEPVTITVPAANAKNIVVKSRDKELYKGDWKTPEDCQVPEVGEPVATVSQTCEGVGFEVKNPENGKDVTVTFTPSTGEPKTVTVTPGKTETVSFPGSEGLTVKVSGDLDALNGEVVWAGVKDCEATPAPSTTPVAGGSGGGEPELPLTGTAVGGIAGAAVLLVAVGGGLFLMARRRKTNFQA